eukprot:3891927-Amphidinium_carterae.2
MESRESVLEAVGQDWEAKCSKVFCIFLIYSLYFHVSSDGKPMRAYSGGALNAERKYSSKGEGKRDFSIVFGCVIIAEKGLRLKG